MSKLQNPSVPRQKYDKAFKTAAVRLVTTGSRSVPDVARSLGISENLLYRWKGSNKHGGHQSGVSQQEHDQLREQLRHTEKECDILKKAGPPYISLFSVDLIRKSTIFD